MTGSPLRWGPGQGEWRGGRRRSRPARRPRTRRRAPDEGADSRGATPDAEKNGIYHGDTESTEKRRGEERKESEYHGLEFSLFFSSSLLRALRVSVVNPTLFGVNPSCTARGIRRFGRDRLADAEAGAEQAGQVV